MSGDPLLRDPPSRSQRCTEPTLHTCPSGSFLLSIVSYLSSSSSHGPSYAADALALPRVPSPLFPQRFCSGCALVWNRIHPGTVWLAHSLTYLKSLLKCHFLKLFKLETSSSKLPFSLPCLSFSQWHDRVYLPTHFVLFCLPSSSTGM